MKNNSILKNTKYPSIAKVEINLDVSTNNENITEVTNNNIEKEQKQISASSIAYQFCKSLKEINSRNENGWSPLYRAIMANNNLAIYELLKLGGDPNISNNLGETPLYLCIEKQNYESLRKLLEYGANVNIQKKNGNTPLHIAFKNKLENKYIIELLRNKADPNIMNKLYNQTPTHLALINKYDEEVLQILKEKNADIYEIKDKYDKTPFDYAKELNDNEYLQKIIKIFGKEKQKILKRSTTKLVEINLDDDIQIELPKEKDNNIFPSLIQNKEDINIPNSNQEKIVDNPKNNDIIISDEITNQINNLKNLINSNKNINKNIESNMSNNEDSNKNNEINKKNMNINKDKKAISLNLTEQNNLLNSIEDFPNKKNINSESKNKLLSNQMKVENSNSEHNKEISKSLINSSINKNKENDKNSNNLLCSNKNINYESLCYSLSKDLSETKNQERSQNKKEKEKDIEINNKIFSLETDKEVIKTVNTKKNDNIELNNEILNLNLLDNEDKKIDVEKNKTSSEKTYNNKNKEKDEILSIDKNDEDNNISLSNNSNIFSDLRMNSTNNNLNKNNIEEDIFNENKISKISVNNTLLNEKHAEQKTDSICDKNLLITKENEIIKNESSKNNYNKDERNTHISNLNNNILDISPKDKNNETTHESNINNIHIIKDNGNKKSFEDFKINQEHSIFISNEEDNLIDLTNKIVKMLKEERNKKNNKNIKLIIENKENENPNKYKTKIYQNKNFLAERHNKRDNSRSKINKGKDNIIYKNYNKFSNYNNNISKSRSIKKVNRNILYNKQKIFRHSSPDYNSNYNLYKSKENLATENSNRNNTSYISILNTNSISDYKNNNLNKRKIYNKPSMLFVYGLSEENINKNKINQTNNKNLIFDGNSMSNTTYSSFYNKNNSRNYIKPLMNSSSLKTNSFSNSNNNNYFQMNVTNPGQSISNNLLIRLRDWLISCDLLCYYNILVKSNMYNIDKIIEDIRSNKINISFKDIEELGIKKPGHIFRLILKLDVDSGKIDNNIYNYIIEQFDINLMTNNGILTSSINNINCCGINLCTNKTHYKNRRIIMNNISNDKNYNYFDENKNNETENEYEENEINYIDIFSFLKKNNLWRFKENFIHNGFDQIEYILLQLFSQYSFDKNILNDYMHIYLEEDKNNVLKILYKEKKKLCFLLGMKFNKEQLKKILLSQQSNDNYNIYKDSSFPTNLNNHNNDNCCLIY